MVIALAPILAVMVVEAVQTAKAAPTVVVPIVAAVTAASNRFVEVSVAVESQRLAQRELYGHCECAARCTTPRGSPVQ